MIHSGVVVELLSTGSLYRCNTGNGCVNVSNLPIQVALPADTFNLFYHIRSLGPN